MKIKFIKTIDSLVISTKVSIVETYEGPTIEAVITPRAGVTINNYLHDIRNFNHELLGPIADNAGFFLKQRDKYNKDLLIYLNKDLFLFDNKGRLNYQIDEVVKEFIKSGWTIIAD